MRDLTLALTIVAVAFAVILVLGARRRILFRLAMKNIARRRRLAAIVILGLLVGTALMSSALVVGDTLEYIFTEDVLQRWGLVDEVVAQSAAGVYIPFNASYFDVLRSDLSAGSAPIDGIAPTVIQMLTVRNEAEELWAEPVSVIGLNSSLEGGLGSLVTVNGGGAGTQDLGFGEIYVNEKVAEKLNAGQGTQLRIYFVQQSFIVTVSGVLRDEGIANLDKQPVIVMSIEEAQQRFAMAGRINLIRISNLGGEEDGAEYSGEVTASVNAIITARGWDLSTNLKVEEVKKDGLDEARQFSRDVTQIFFMMGAFAVVAGILLIINIFVMMAEERKSDMGVTRAVGMTKSQLTQTFLFEGAIYAAVSSVIGAIVGLGLGFTVIYLMSVIVPISERGIAVTFHYDPSSVVLAFAVGVLITLITVAIASWWISRLNIVRAIRAQPEPIPKKITKVEAAVTGLLALGGVGAFMARAYPPANIAWVPLFILAGIIGSMRFVDPRWTSTFGGIGMMAWILGPKFVELDEPDIYIPFVLAGLLLVLGGVLFVVHNTTSLQRTVMAVGGRKKGRPVLKTALTYPMSKKFRTGMTLAMFSLIMFAISIISMIQGMQASGIERAVPTQTGGYDFVAYTSTFQRIDDANWSQGLQNSGVSQHVESISNATVVPAFVIKPGGGESIPYTLWGVDNVLIKTNTFGFRSTLSSYTDRFGVVHEVHTARDVWNALSENDTLALVDGNAASGVTISPVGGELKLEVGDVVRVSSDNGYRNFTILGILEQSLPGTMGLFVDQKVVLGNYSVTWSAYFFQLKPGASPSFVANALTAEFITYGLRTIVVADILGQVLEMADRVLLLMQAYLGIGLIVGIAGLAVITVRAVVERRQQIGVLRAIGYTKNMVMTSFILEVSFVAAFGTAIGMTLGVLLSYRVWSLFFQDITPFVIPWMHMAVVAFIAGIVTVLATASPAIRASKIPPAEALKYIE